MKNFNEKTIIENIITKYKDLLINDPYALNTLEDNELYIILTKYPFLLHFIDLDHNVNLDLIEELMSINYNIAKFVNEKVLIDHFINSNINIIKYLEEDSILDLLPKIMFKTFFSNNTFYILINILEKKLKEDPQFLYNKFKNYNINNIVFNDIFALINYKFNPDTFFIIMLLYSNIEGFPEYLERILSLIPKEKYTDDDIGTLLSITLNNNENKDDKYLYNIVFRYFKENIYTNIEKFSNIFYGTKSIIIFDKLEYQYDKNMIEALKKIPLTESRIRNNYKTFRYITDEELENIFLNNEYIQAPWLLLYYSRRSRISSKIKDHYIDIIQKENYEIEFILDDMTLNKNQINTLIDQDIKINDPIYNLQESYIKDIIEYTEYKHRFSLLYDIIYHPNIFGIALEDIIREYFKLELN